MTSSRWIAGIAAYLLLVAAFGYGVWSYAYRDGLDRLSERGQSNLAFASDRVSANLLRYRELAVVLSRHPSARTALHMGQVTRGAANLVLSMADMTGARSVSFVGTAGNVIVSSSPDFEAPRPDRQPLARALHGALGTAHRIVPHPGHTPGRVFSFAAPVLNAERRIAGAVITEVDVEALEESWPGNAPAVLFSDDAGRVMVTNRSGLVHGNRTTGQDFPAYSETRIGPHTVWALDGDRYLPDRALYLRRSLPVLGLHAEILLDTSAASRGAFFQMAVAVALSLVLGGVMFLIAQQSRVLRHRLTVEAEANERLEQRVSERTRALSEVNVELRHEVHERTEAEHALKKAQDDLVQAGKLSALGQMSAGISHELNQPLMAIQSFAENGGMLLDMGKPDVARQNLSRISELARRMGRIIKNLRAFSRQESGPMSDVDLVQVVNDAVEMTAKTIARLGVSLDWAEPPAPVMVRGGEVRLTQVVVNLISNAADAMESAAEKRLTIRIEPAADAVFLTVRDTGPGIVEPERVFEPFYSTKAVGSAKGMGLGLSISYGLVQSFGGAIKGGNHPEGGAVFTVGLVPAALGAAA